MASSSSSTSTSTSTSTTPLLSSPPSTITDLQQYWLNNSTNTFINHLNTNTNLQTCIFQLPETLTSEKPDSYIPNHIGLGPIQHFRTDLYTKQEQLKLTTSKTFLEPCNVTPEFHKTLHNKLTELVPQVRCCYDLYFNTSDECLSWVFVVDAIFLLDVILKVSMGGLFEHLEDIIMVENQIPLVILSQLINTIKQHSNEEFDDLDLAHLLVKFCETCSPLKFTTPETQIDLDDVSNTYHLLDCMHRLIVNYNLPPQNPFLRTSLLLDVHLEDVENAVQMAGGLFPGLNVFLQPVLVVLKLPWDKIMNWIKKVFGENPTMLEIDIPSVSKLSKVGKVEFLSTNGGIRDIKFDEEKPLLILSVLDLKPVSEVVLRNLVAYEELMFKNDNIRNLYFGEYVELMCGIIDGVKDVKILREKNIIEGDMKDEDIVKLFNGISRSSVKKDGKKSELRKTVEKVNEYYGGIPRVKVWNVIKKVFLASWKVLLILFSVVSLVLAVVTGVCQVYDCKRTFGLGHVRLALDYVTQGNQVV
ncbi:putative UPF0481 protein At3g02645 [Bidens hawaiensis]|uniref:putative UPF0481 protein At3g02645 n=1 Tax=Bidens hawaiensis TaxID=980011 RepID=UPI00404B30FD